MSEYSWRVEFRHYRSRAPLNKERQKNLWSFLSVIDGYGSYPHVQVEALSNITEENNTKFSDNYIYNDVMIFNASRALDSYQEFVDEIISQGYGTHQIAYGANQEEIARSLMKPVNIEGRNAKILIVTKLLTDDTIAVLVQNIVEYYEEELLNHFSEEEIANWMENTEYNYQQRRLDEQRNKYLSKLEKIKQQFIEQTAIVSMQKQLQEKEMLIRVTLDTIDEKYREIEDLEKKKHDLEKELAYLVIAGKESKEVKEFFEFLKISKNIEITGYENDVITMIIKAKLSYWEVDDAATLYNSPRTNWLNKYKTKRELPEDGFRDKVYKAIFINRTVDLMLGTEVKVNVVQGTFMATRTELSNETNAIANPHHKNFNCWGSYDRPIRGAMHNADYTNMVALMTAAVAGINVLEVPTTTKFEESFWTHPNTKFLRYKNKEVSINDLRDIWEREEALSV